MDMNIQTKTIDGNTSFTVHLSQTMKTEQWEVLLKVLSKGPYEIVSPMIQSIVSQIISQSNTPGQEQMEDENVQSN